MTAPTMIYPHPAVPSYVARPAQVNDLGEFEAHMNILPELTDPQERAVYLHMAAYHAERCAALLPDLHDLDEWAVIAEVCQAVAATEHGFVKDYSARTLAWMDDPHWAALACGEYDRAAVLRTLHAEIKHLLPAGAARVLERIAASEVTRDDAVTWTEAKVAA